MYQALFFFSLEPKKQKKKKKITPDLRLVKCLRVKLTAKLGHKKRGKAIYDIQFYFLLISCICSIVISFTSHFTNGLQMRTPKRRDVNLSIFVLDACFNKTLLKKCLFFLPQYLE